MRVKHFLIALALAPALGFAQTADSYTDIDGTTWSYTLDASNQATITGATPALSGVVVIPGSLGGYTVVGIVGVDYSTSNGIENNAAITAVSFPPTMKVIGDWAFANCTSLKGALTIPDGVTTIGAHAFQSSFVGGSKGALLAPYGDLKIPGSVTSIGAYAFDGCSNLTGDLTLPSGLTQISDDAFMGCVNLTGSLDIPDGVTYIGRQAFFSCSNLNGTLTIPSSVTTIAGYAFVGCSKLTGDLIIPDGITTIEHSTFMDCGSLDGTLTIPSSVTTIAGYAFDGCSKLSGGLTLPTGLTTIGDRAFSDCSKLSGDLTIPGNVTTIGTYAFENCRGFDGELTLPNTIASINDYTFYSCSQLKGSLTIPANITTIGDQAFNYCASFTSLSLHEGLTTIGNSAFSNCQGLSMDLTIPASVTSIGNQAFSPYVGFRSVTIQSPDLTIGYNVFGYCPYLEYLDMSASSFATGMAMPSSFARDNFPYSAINPFGNTAAHTVIYLPGNADPALVTAAGAANFNFVLNGKCDWFYVQDASNYYIPKAFTAATATWNVDGTGMEATPNATRQLTAGEYVTAYLPYDFTLDNNNIKGYSLSSKNNHKPGDTDNTLVFTQNTTGQYLANTPYVIRVVSEGSFPEMDATTNPGGITVPATPISKVLYGAVTSYDGSLTALDNPGCATTVADPVSGKWGFYGTTETVPASLERSLTWNPYTLDDGEWHPFTGDLDPMRTFIVGYNTPLAAKPAFKLVNADGTEDTTTSIDGIGVVSNGDTRIYSVSGQYVGDDLNSLPKGLYVVNGKKVVK